MRGGRGTNAFKHGTVHEVSADMQAALRADPAIVDVWDSLNPLGRNEFICWVEDAKQQATRERRIRRTREELLEGKKRPCCWACCVHRTDKPPSMAAGGSNRSEVRPMIGARNTAPPGVAKYGCSGEINK